MIKECKECKKEFNGHGLKIFCSYECKLKDRREKQREKRKLDPKARKKIANKKYYLKTRRQETKKTKLKKENWIKNRRLVNNKWTKNNRERVAEYRKKTKDKTKKWVDNYKKTLCCEQCGEKRWYLLDFHHKDPKQKKINISHAYYLYGKKEIINEIKKCIPLCANCHRELHFLEKEKRLENMHNRYLEIISQPKISKYSLAEEEFKKKWYKDLKNQAKKNLNKFSGNQYVKLNKEKDCIKKENIINTTKALAAKIGVGEHLASHIIQVYNRGTEEEKQQAKKGTVAIYKIVKEICKRKKIK